MDEVVERVNLRIAVVLTACFVFRSGTHTVAAASSGQFLSGSFALTIAIAPPNFAFNSLP